MNEIEPSTRRLALVILLFISCLASSWTFAGEREERSAIAGQVREDFIYKKFSELDARQAAYLQSRETTPSGIMKLTLMHHAFREIFRWPKDDAPNWAAAESSIDEWVASNPRSSLARLVYARFLIGRAMSYRGGGYANTVDKEAWAPFAEHMERARAYLESNKAIASADPVWYELMGIIGQNQGWPEQRYAKTLYEGLDRYPFYHQLYFTALDHYSPRWGGSAIAIEKFSREAVKRTKATEGFSLYARLYSYAAQVEYDDAIFSGTTEVDWSTMKKGIDDLLARYPDQWNVNNYARLSCLAADRPKTAELMNRIHGDPILTLWHNDVNSYKRCRSWALAN